MRIALLLPAIALASCATTPVDVPSLDPRPAEAIDPRLPVGDPDAEAQPADPALLSRLEALLASAVAARDDFDALADDVVARVDAAGAPGSESWTAAAEWLSRLDASREPVSRALADTDAIAAERIERAAWVAPSDREAIERTGDAIARIDAQQAALIDRLTGRLNP